MVYSYFFLFVLKLEMFFFSLWVTSVIRFGKCFNFWFFSAYLDSVIEIKFVVFAFSIFQIRLQGMRLWWENMVMNLKLEP